jgi:predicted nucleic acid-binding protein
MDGETVVIADASVLINFLVIDRVQLLAALPGRRLVVTDHVRSEVTDHYPDQMRRLEEAFSAGLITEMAVTELSEVQAFALLTSKGLGLGECSAIAVAAHRGYVIAIDDKTARKHIAAEYPGLAVLTTESIVVELIKAGVIDVAAADALKGDWEKNHRFRLPFDSFQSRLQ